MSPLLAIATLSLVLLAPGAGGYQSVGGNPAWLLPGPREAVAGMNALDVRSRVVLRASPEVPWELKATFAFPDRARVYLAAKEDGSGRTLRYRFGELAPFLAPLATTSDLLAGEERLDSLRRLELRRAVMMWPHGLEWEGEGQSRRAAAGALGTFFAVLDEAGRPISIECRLADGEVPFALDAIRWNAGEGRAQPLAMTFVERGVALWDETVERVLADFECIDRYFLPADRREYVAERDDMGRTEPATFPRVTWRRVALPDGLDWPDARARAEELTRQATAELAPLSLALEPVLTFELTDSGRPVAVLLQLEDAADDPPEGWRTLPPCPGAQVRLRSVRQVRYEALQTLREAAGGGEAPPLMIVPDEGAEDRSVVVFIATGAPR